MVIQVTQMKPGKGKGRDILRKKDQDGYMAPEKGEAAKSAWEGADLERPIEGENPETDSPNEARHWVAVYSNLVELEQKLLDLLARMIPNMPRDAQREAEETNLPVLASQIERFRHRLEYWSKRRTKLEKGPE